MKKGLSKKEKEAILEIAKKYIYAMTERGDFERRWNDEEDFIETSVMGLEGALEEAYQLGKASKG